MSEIAPLLSKMGLEHRAELRSAAEDLLRTINRKVNSGSLRKAEVARPAIAISCAFRQLGENPPTSLWKETGLKTFEIWKETLTKVENLAGLRSLSVVSLDTLGVRHGGIGSIVMHAQGLMKGLQANGGDVSDPVCVVASYWVSSKQSLGNKESNELKEILLSEYSLEKKRFNNVCSRIEDQVKRQTEGPIRKQQTSTSTGSVTLSSRALKRPMLRSTNEVANSHVAPARLPEDELLRSSLSRLGSAAANKPSSKAAESSSSIPDAKTNKARLFHFTPVDNSILGAEYLSWKAAVLAQSGRTPLPLADSSFYTGLAGSSTE
mmetsp:Transcript_87912/g.175858  ORF Transcript_87912/g.175858 Transcript_87912/m.175858 type:complete len:321 (+) Transcript_87912:91-1053(+)